MRTETKTVSSTSSIFNVQGCILTDFLITDIGLHEEPANFYREKRIVAFVTGHLFTFICLVTPQILISENQTIKTKDIKKRAWNISQKHK